MPIDNDYHLNVQIDLDEDAVAPLCLEAGCFVLISNLSSSQERVQWPVQLEFLQAMGVNPGSLDPSVRVKINSHNILQMGVESKVRQAGCHRQKWLLAYQPS